MTQNDCSCVSEKNYLSIGNCTNSFLFFFIFFRKPKLDNIARLNDALQKQMQLLNYVMQQNAYGGGNFGNTGSLQARSGVKEKSGIW